jgi:hypothetical protein
MNERPEQASLLPDLSLMLATAALVLAIVASPCFIPRARILQCMHNPIGERRK